MQEECSFQLLSVQYEFDFLNENVLRESGLLTHKFSQNRNFENGGVPIQIGILHVLMNILSITLLFRVHDMSGCFEMKRVVMSFYFSKKINKMQVAS